MRKALLTVAFSLWLTNIQAQSDVIFADSFAYLDNCSLSTPSFCHPVQISTDGLHINEIMYYPHARGIVDEDIPVFPWIEIYYKGDLALDLSEVTIKTNSQNINANLPFAVMNDAHLTIIMLPVGTIASDFGLADDLDFSDKHGEVYLDMNGSISPIGDDVAIYLYNNMTSFVAYGDAFPDTSQLEIDAVNGSLWIMDDRVSIDDKYPGETLSLKMDGFYDNNNILGTRSEADFDSVSWNQQSPSIHQQPSNAIQISPPDGSIITSFPQTLTWQSCDGASGYLLEIRNSESGDDLVLQRITQTTEYTIKKNEVDFDSLYWTIACLYNDIEKSSPFSQPWFLATGVISDGGPTGNVLGVGHEYQRKDTNMLCLYSFDYNLGKNRGYGCEEEIIHPGGTCNWDSPHNVASANDVRQCGAYGANNCVRASIQMVHQYRSSDSIAINQDYISYLAFNNKKPAGPAKTSDPEGDLGAGVGMSLDPTKSVISTLFGISSNDITVEDDPSFNTIKNWIDEDRPIILWRWASAKLGHSTVIYGYQSTPHRTLFVHDPTLGNITVRYNEYMNKNVSASIPIKAIVIPETVGTLVGNPPNSIHGDPMAHVFNDTTDSDGVVNFDEIYRFNTEIDSSDSDFDQVNDKQEVHSYTFPLGIGTFSFRNPDIDSDTVRAELDCNTDNDFDHDGGEDINNNGGHGELFGVGIGETDKFDITEHSINLALDKAVYMVGDDVKLIGGTLSANTSYDTQTVSCPGLSPDNALSGIPFSTDDSGFGNNTIGACALPGCYIVHLDVAKDNIWQQTSFSGDEIYSCDQSFQYTCTCSPIDDGDDDELDPDGISPVTPEPFFDIKNITNLSLNQLDVDINMQPGQAGAFPQDFIVEIVLEIANPQGNLPTQPPQTQGGSIWIQLQIPEIGSPMMNLQVWNEINGWQTQNELLNDFVINLEPTTIELVQLQLAAINPIVIDTQEVQFSGIRLISHVPGENTIDVIPEPVILNPGLEFVEFVDLLQCQ